VRQGGPEDGAAGRQRDALAAVADELYGLPPEDFTAARDARARELRDGGNRDLAQDVKRLPKATTAAWVVNLLAREHPDVLTQLVDLGAALRAAQADVDPPRMRELNAQRHGVVTAVVRQARTAARATGRPVSESVAGQVEDTLRAAMADPAAAAAVRSGRLVQPLASTGLGPVDLDGAVAVPEALDLAEDGSAGARGSVDAPTRLTDGAEGPGAGGARKRGDRSTADGRKGAGRRRSDDDRPAVEERRAEERRAAEARRAAQEREGRLREARADEDTAADAARRAHEAADAARSDHDDATARRDDAHAAVDDLRRRLGEAEDAARAADAEVRETRRHRDTAARAETKAGQALERARHRLRRLDDQATDPGKG
jgi:hypothetical protein